jgi:diguanylate cyclase (GGDEF)-like protein/PAS domain S-box-containing protein
MTRTARAALAWSLAFLGVVPIAPVGGQPTFHELVERDWVFEPLEGPERALAQHTVTALLEDARGYLWIGTQGGLHRYDGETMRLWRADDGLPESFVTALALGAEDRLWIGGSAATLACLDLRTGRIEPLPPKLATLDEQGPGPVVALHEDERADLWIALPDRILRFERGTQELSTLLRLDQSHPRSVPVRDLFPEPEGALLAVADGVIALDRKGRARRLGQVLERPARSVLRRRDRSLVLAGAAGILRLEDRVWHPLALPGVTVTRLAEDDQGRLWAGTLGQGLWQIDDKGARRFRREERPRGLHDDSIQSLLVDRRGALWVGGFARGLVHTDTRGAFFSWLTGHDGSDLQPRTGNARALVEDSSGGLWVGFDGEGLWRIDRAARTVEKHDAVLRETLGLAATDPVRVTALAFDGEGRLWAATPQGILRQRAQGGFERIPEEGGQSEPRALLLGRDGTLWVGFRSGGVGGYGRDGGRRILGFATASARLRREPMVLAIFEDRAGELWVATAAGLARWRREWDAPRFVALEVDGAPASPSTGLVRHFLEDGEGRLWLATHGGLLRVLEMREDRLVAERLLPPALTARGDTTVYALLEAQGKLWLSSNVGILRFDPLGRGWHLFDRRHGLESLEFNGAAALRLRDGRLAFGGVAGIVLGRDRPEHREDPPPLAIRAVRILEEGTRAVEIEPPPDRLHLSASSAVIQFDFGVIDPAQLSEYRIAWRLSGFDRVWTEAGRGRTATFSHLPAGDYRFDLMAESADFGITRTGIEIAVAPPWWASWTARVLYGLAGLLIFLAIFAVQRRRRLQHAAHERALAEREQRLRLALWGSGDEYWDWDIAGGRFYRLGADLLLGYKESEQIMDSDEWRHRAVHPEDRERVERLLAEHLAGASEYFESEHRIRDAAGRWIWVRSRGKVVERDAEGRPLRMAGTARDVTEARRIERDRRIAAEVIRCMSEGVAVLDPSFHFVSVNPAFTRITGYQAEELLGEDAGMLDGSLFPVEERRRLRERLAAEGHWHGEIWQRRRDGSEVLCELEAHEVLDAEGRRAFFVAVLSDITDRKRAEQELRYLANYDTLTGLPNRTLLGERLAHAIVRARRQGSRVAVLFLDLDRFKHVNDSLGHAVGDRLLRAAGERLRQIARDGDTVARLGGDEFTVVLEDVRDLSEVERSAERLLDAFREPLALEGGQDVVISPSIGIALYPDHGDVPSDLLKFADTAMYQAKERGRNTYQFYVEAMDLEARRRASMGAALRRALERHELRLVYQPKLDIKRDRICGVEALLRWHSADFGVVPPASFVPLAEESGLIVPIGEWVLMEAAGQLRRLDELTGLRLSMAVNVSVMQLLRGDLDRRLARILADTRTSAQRIELELTETVVMANPEQSIRTLRALKATGVRLAIDDFGTGYSSLAYLKRLPIDTLKIDKTFVSDLIVDPDDEAITATIIAMAHTLDLSVVAEGVENREQLDYLRRQGCDLAQGFFIGEPLPGAALADWLREHASKNPAP